MEKAGGALFALGITLTIVTFVAIELYLEVLRWK